MSYKRNQPYAYFESDAAQTLTDSTDTNFSNWTEIASSNASPISETGGTFNFTEAGLYLVSAVITFVSNTTGYRYVSVNVTGGLNRKVTQSAVNGDLTTMSVTTLVRFTNSTGSRQMRINVFQDSGGNLDCGAASGNNINTAFIQKLE